MKFKDHSKFRSSESSVATESITSPKRRLRSSTQTKVADAIQYVIPRTPRQSDAEEAFRAAVKERLASLTPTEALSAWQTKVIAAPQFEFLNIASRLSLAGVEWEREGRLSIIPADVLHSLSCDSDHEIQLAVGSNPNTPLRALEYLAKSDHFAVRAGIARNLSASPELLDRLGHDEEPQVREAVCENPVASPDLIARFAADSDYRPRRAYESRHQVNPNPHREEVIDFEACALDSNEKIRCMVARRHDAPVTLLNRLSTDKSRHVRQLLAKNPWTPTAALELLAKEPYDAWIRFSVAGNPSTPMTTLIRLLESQDLGLALTASANPSIPVKISEPWRDRFFGEPGVEWLRTQLKKTSWDAKAAYDRADFLFTSIKDSARSVLGKGPISAVLGLCAGSEIEPASLSKVVGSTDWLVRAAVARHKSTPQNLLKNLREDIHPVVTALARQRGG
jgi:hypothetical protein